MQTFARRPEKGFPRRILIATLSILIFCAGCSDSDNRPRYNSGGDQEPELLPVAEPKVELPPDIRRIVLTTTQFNLATVGYQEAEFFLSGEATSFSNLSELGSDGLWDVEPATTANYKTRIVVIRPIDDNNFSGTVFVEWLNVSAGFDNPPSWYAGHTEALRRGHAWVFVSAQRDGIEGRDDAVIPLAPKLANPERYESLSITSDSYSYDIFSQVSMALRSPSGLAPLGELQPTRVMAVGESQSANRLVVYVNAVHPLYAPYDGYLIHSRTGGEFSTYSLSQPPEVALPTPPDLRVRDDLEVPILMYQTETDLLTLQAVVARQDDSDYFRLWETVGTSHSDYYTNVSGRSDTGVDPQFAVVVEEPSIFGFINCTLPMNAGPGPWLFNNALYALETWVTDGLAPSSAERTALSDDQTQIMRDDFGNALGGIRSPYVDAPAATLSGDGQEGESFCALFGVTELFDAATMAMLYGDQDGYVAAVTEATDAAIDNGFLLEDDRQRIIDAAGLQWLLLE
ncbi:MAG: alpha/beta hydrolase domain-containing protein [Halieaceae bacterium]